MSASNRSNRYWLRGTLIAIAAAVAIAATGCGNQNGTYKSRSATKPPERTNTASQADPDTSTDQVDQADPTDSTETAQPSRRVMQRFCNSPHMDVASNYDRTGPVDFIGTLSFLSTVVADDPELLSEDGTSVANVLQYNMRKLRDTGNKAAIYPFLTDQDLADIAHSRYFTYYRIREKLDRVTGERTTKLEEVESDTIVLPIPINSSSGQQTDEVPLFESKIDCSDFFDD